MIKVVKGNLLEQDVEAIVNPANSWMIMGGGVAGQIKRHGGEWIENEAMQAGQVSIGEAVATSAGKLKARFVIHAPTMKRPVERTDTDKVYLATRAAMVKAKELGVTSIAFPCMGCGVGRVPPLFAAKAMLRAINEVGHDGMTVLLVAINDKTGDAFRKALENEDNN